MALSTFLCKETLEFATAMLAATRGTPLGAHFSVFFSCYADIICTLFGGKASSLCTPLLFGFQVVSLLEILGAQLIGIAPAWNTGKPLCSLS